MLERALKLKPEDRHSARLADLRVRAHIVDPADVLPAEIWQEIMVAGSDDPHFGLKCASVSKKWRAKTLECRAAWQDLILTSKRPLEKAKTWIERSGGKLNRLEVTLPGSSPAISVSTCLALSNALLPAIPRLSVLHLMISHSGTVSRITETWRHKAESLRDIKIRTMVLDLIRLDAALLSPSATSLRSLEYRGTRLGDISMPLQSFSPSQVSRLRRASITFLLTSAWGSDASIKSLVLDLVRHASNLEQLSVQHHYSAADEGARGPDRIELPRLASFSQMVSGVLERGLNATWLPCLSMPALTSMHIKHERECLTPEQLVAQCQTSNIQLGKIESLKLEPTSMSGESAQPLFQACRALESLSLRGDFDDTVLDVLKEVNLLKRLSLQSPRITPGAIMRLVVARKLDSLLIVHPHNWDKKAEDWLKRNVQVFRVDFDTKGAQERSWSTAMQRIT